MEQFDFHLKLLKEIGELVNDFVDLDQILSQTVQKIAENLHFEVVSIYLWDSATKELILKNTVGLKLDKKNPIKLKSGEGLTGVVFSTKRALCATPASNHPKYKYFEDLGEEKYESFLGVPILIHHKCIGVLVAQTTILRHINPAEETLFHIVSSRLAGLLEVADKLERLQSKSKLPHATKALQGKGISPGLVFGETVILKGLSSELKLPKRKYTSNVPKEIERLKVAFMGAEHDLKVLVESLESEGILTESEINIFNAHLMILKDIHFHESIFKNIKNFSLVAEHAVSEGIEEIAEQFESKPQKYLQDRAQDFRDLGHKIMHHLLDVGTEDISLIIPKNAIAVAKDIPPSLLTHLYKSKISGIITEKGGETSHTSILAKSLGIPAVSEIDSLSQIKNHQKILLDGNTGFIFINPDDSLIHEFENSKRISGLETYESLEVNETKLAHNLNTLRITANIGFPVDIKLANQHKIDEVGLFRTEFAFMQWEHWPKIEEQTSMYLKMADQFKGSITVRTLDIGADKTLPYLSFPEEKNPLLGLRSIRFSMEYLDLFRNQIRSILKANLERNQFKILLPMVSQIWEVETAKEIIMDIGAELSVPNSSMPALGIMLEVPSVFFQIEDYLKIVDFISVGTNDMVQYLLAVDRDSKTVGHLYSSFHPAIFRLLHETLMKVTPHKKPITICGELAGSTRGALALLALGYTNLSLLPSNYPQIKYLLSHVDLDKLDPIKKMLLSESKANDIQFYLNEALAKYSEHLVSNDLD